jgi:hypothetical protein
MFQNILVVFITLEHTEHTYDAAFELAKKFDSKITFLPMTQPLSWQKSLIQKLHF